MIPKPMGNLLTTLSVTAKFQAVVTLVIDRAITPRWKQFSIQESPVMCRGDLAFLCNNKALSKTLHGDFDDVFSTDFTDILRTYAQEQAVYSMMATAFPADLEDDEEDLTNVPSSPHIAGSRFPCQPYLRAMYLLPTASAISIKSTPKV